MSKLSSLAKDSVRNMEKTVGETTLRERMSYEDGFKVGFEAAFKEIGERAVNKISHLEQYPMMNERIFALKAYIKTMDEMLEEMKSNE